MGSGIDLDDDDDGNTGEVVSRELRYGTSDWTPLGSNASLGGDSRRWSHRLKNKFKLVAPARVYTIVFFDVMNNDTSIS